MTRHIVTRVREGKVRCDCGTTFTSRHPHLLWRKVLTHLTAADLAAVALAAATIPNSDSLEPTQREADA